MRVLKFPVLILAAAVVLAGCEKSENPVGASSLPPVNSAVQPSLAKVTGSTGTVTVIHGVPGLVVDVYVNGALTLPGFKPGTITDPLQLPQGNYYIQITPQGKDTTQTVIKGSTFLPAGANASIIAHLSATGMPELSVYVNNLSGLARGKSRLVVRHDAAAPAVDVNLYRGKNGKKLLATIPNLSNPKEASADVRPGRYSVTLSPAGTSTVVFGPAPLKPRPGVAYFVYAIGSLSDKTFGLLVQTIDLSPRKHHWGNDSNDEMNERDDD